MFNYEALETELATKLDTYLASKTVTVATVVKNANLIIKSMPVPETQLDFSKEGQFTFVHWQYGGGNYEPSKSLSPRQNQPEGITLLAIVTSAKLRGETGIYKTLDHIKMCALGYKPANCQLSLSLIKCEMVESTPGYYVYVLSFSTQTVAVQPTYEEPILGSPQRIPDYIIQTPNQQ